MILSGLVEVFIQVRGTTGLEGEGNNKTPPGLIVTDAAGIMLSEVDEIETDVDGDTSDLVAGGCNQEIETDADGDMSDMSDLPNGADDDKFQMGYRQMNEVTGETSDQCLKGCAFTDSATGGAGMVRPRTVVDLHDLSLEGGLVGMETDILSLGAGGGSAAATGASS